ncbi:MAG: AmmeMemoRadiSam system radical SAM enzyme [Dehalococcoidia bacterium]|jgi:pyruvate formate lyase activating enzyme|nr:AmmeMemoRadiSam system radical SAM enzyme [Dehalococcoidia bacterium]
MPKLIGRAITLAQLLDRYCRPGELYEKLDGDKVRCFACGHRCLIHPGQRGICQVRFNRHGVLMVPHNYVAALQCDPIEKKPFFHVLPGALALTFGMLGCDYHCPYCQNWVTSQALRDPVAGIEPMEITAHEMVRIGERMGAHAYVSSYNEPLITSEWAVEVFRLAKAKGCLTAYVSNGNATREVLEYLRPWLDCYKVDLKSMSPKNYRYLGGKLENVLETIRMAHQMGYWVEVVTLVVPGFNDSDQELREAARFIASVSKDIPWHVTAFHKDYKMTEPENTDALTLLRAARIGKEEGLNFVYAGNLPGMVGELENTYCPQCGHLLVERFGYRIRRYEVTTDGLCPQCGARIPGIWWRGPRPRQVSDVPISLTYRL